MTLKLPPARLTLGQPGKGPTLGSLGKKCSVNAYPSFSTFLSPPGPVCTSPSALGSVGMIDEPCCFTPPPWVQMCWAAAVPCNLHLLPRSAAVTLLLGKQARCPGLQKSSFWQVERHSFCLSQQLAPGGCLEGARALGISATAWNPFQSRAASSCIAVP